MKGRALLAEFIGTFALVFVGSMAIMTNFFQGADSGRLGVALAHGFTIAVFASATMAVSGGHFNPAVSFGLWLGKRITLARMLGYWVVQCAGAIAAAFVVNAIPKTDEVVNKGFHTIAYTLPALAEGLKVEEGLPIYGILIEAILTFFLVYVVIGTAADRRAHKVGGLFIGLAITLDILAGGPLTGAAMNPARWLGPAFVLSGEIGVTGVYENWAVYILGPMLGGALAAVLYGRESEAEGM